VMALPFDTKGLVVKELFDDAFVVATGPAYRPRGKGAITVDEINNNPLLLLEQGHCLRDQTIEVCGGAGSNAHNAFTATSLSTILEMVANDYGLTLLPEMSLAKEANDPRIRLLPLAPPVPSRKIAIVWRKSSSYGQFYTEIGDLINRQDKTQAEMRA